MCQVPSVSWLGAGVLGGTFILTPSSVASETPLLVGTGHGPHRLITTPGQHPPIDSAYHSAAPQACRTHVWPIILETTGLPQVGPSSSHYGTVSCCHSAVAHYMDLIHVRWPLTCFLALSVTHWNGALSAHSCRHRHHHQH